MSSDQLAASAEGSVSAVVPRDVASDEVVVPLRAPAAHLGNPVVSRAAGRPKAGVSGAGAAQVVMQLTDYINREPCSPTPKADLVRVPSIASHRAAAPPVAPPPIPASVALHADELDGLLHQHIESHLQRIAAHAPDLVQPVDNVRRSVELLLKLRRR